VRAKDLADARYHENLTVADMVAAAALSPAHFSRQFKAAFGESPHQYLLTRRLERPPPCCSPPTGRWPR
jgi:AraC-like DNA-binding protein